MSTVNIEKANNYHISKTEEGYLVEYNDGLKLYEINIINDSVAQKTVKDFCDERILLSDGKILKRVRDVLTVKEN